MYEVFTNKNPVVETGFKSDESGEVQPLTLFSFQECSPSHFFRSSRLVRVVRHLTGRKTR